jgi:signal recognition particle subunit SRP54
MADMMKRMSRQAPGGRGGIGSMMGSLFGGGLGGGLGGLMPGKTPGGGMPDLAKLDPAEMERMARQLGMGGAMPNLPGLPGKRK